MIVVQINCYCYCHCYKLIFVRLTSDNACVDRKIVLLGSMGGTLCLFITPK